MKAGTVLEMVRGGKLGVAVRLQTLAKPFYRVCFLGGALRHGMLEPFRRGPQTAEGLEATLGTEPASRDALESWLRIGCLVGELERSADGYRPRGLLARKLLLPTHDAMAAMLEEVATLHAMLLVDGPGRILRGERFGLDDQEGELIARSSRVLEPPVTEAVRDVVPPTGELRLLEVGCGSGVYLRTAAEQNARLEGLGLELQPDVADQARRNLARWGLADRITVETGDVRGREPDAESPFDLATLHNNIYYFAVEERVALLRHLRRFLRPGGTLLITTGTAGGGVVMEVLSLWASMTEGCGRLPSPPELEQQLREAGFEPDAPRALVPGEAYHAFVARVPG